MRTLAFCVLLGAAGHALAQNAADQYFDPEVMAAARARLAAHHGNQVNSLILGERFEYLAADGDDTLLWEGQGWIGRDLNKLWLKTEGDYDVEASRLEEAELQALYSRAIHPFWELQAGIRHDFRPDPSRTHLAMGIQGLAPQWFEIDAALFLSDEGVVSSRLEVEYEIRLTQRLLLQPRIELNAAFSDDEEIGVGSGLSTADAGLRLRYEIRREFAPYFGVSWQEAFGSTRDLGRAAGEDTSGFAVLAGFRFWY